MIEELNQEHENVTKHYLVLKGEIGDGSDVRINFKGNLHTYIVGDFNSMFNCIQEVIKEVESLNDIRDCIKTICVSIERADGTCIDSISAEDVEVTTEVMNKMLMV